MKTKGPAALLALFALMATACGSSHASSVANAPHVMSAAPSLDVFGITLGSKPSLPDCPTITDSTGWPTFDEITWQRNATTCLEVPSGRTEPVDGRLVSRTIHFPTPQRPTTFSGDGPTAFTATVFDGVVGSVSMLTDGYRNQVAVFTELKKKYGEPTDTASTKSDPLHPNDVEPIDVQWVFTNLVVSFRGALDVDHGVLSISTPEDYAFENAPKIPKGRRL
jgi:hypothetical protein